MARQAVLVLVALAGLGGPAAAQDPDTTRVEPTDTTDIEADSVAAVPERPPYEPPRWAFSLTTGFVGFGELQTQRIVAWRTDDEGAVTSTLLQRGMEADGGLQIGASALLGLSPAWAVRAGAGWGRGRLAGSVSGADESLEAEVAALPLPGRGEFRVLSGELALRFRTLSGRRLQPYLELGVAALRWDMDGAPIPGGQGMDGRTRWGALAAAGGVVPIWPGLAGRVQLSGIYFRTPLAPAPPGPLGAGEDLILTFPEPQAGSFADPRIERVRSVRLDVGLSMELGRAPSAPPVSEADAPPTDGRR